MTQDEIIRENAGDAMKLRTQSPEGTKKMPAPDSNTWGAADPEPPGNGQTAPAAKSQGSGGDREPTYGEQLAGVISSDPNMKWESQLAKKMNGAEGVTMPSEDES